MITIEQDLFLERQLLCDKLLELLALSQWSEDLLKEACIKSGFAQDYHYWLFPQGLKEAIKFFESYCDQKMLEQLSDFSKNSGTTTKIKQALLVRIKSLPPVVHAKNATYFRKSTNCIIASQVAWRTCDVIWHYASDNSTDFNYYTKRGLLVSIYLASICYYIRDSSPNFQDTDEFVNNALAKIVTAATTPKKLIKNFKNLPIIRMF